MLVCRLAVAWHTPIVGLPPWPSPTSRSLTESRNGGAGQGRSGKRRIHLGSRRAAERTHGSIWGKESPAGARYGSGCGADFLGQGGRPGERFRKAFAWTAFPIITLSVISVSGLYPLWFLAAAIWVGAPLVAIFAAVARAPGERTSASGILAGFGVGAIALATTCFANLATGF